MNRRPWALGAVAALVFAFLYAPIAWLALVSFNDSRSLSRVTELSLRWYAELVRDSRVLDALGLSLRLAAASAVVATVIGTLAAFGLRRAFPGRNAWTVLLSLPLVAPAVAAGAAFAFLLSFDDVVASSYPTGVGSTTLPVFVYAQAGRRGVSPEIVALSTAMVAVSAALLVAGVLVVAWRARRASPASTFVGGGRDQGTRHAGG
ncbi:hypothetical protein FHX81_5828 [Saccharothrix saharensis]|uniref:ABC transmembrane type-1 domain-containing protein n=1 Tax=Saccharothrix saharensis TaxID=571190 RepID=A0A543JKP4_9PSEU|nr:ABC transporter permease [Saccharothrix saharensis]TQM83405.1 hypothetical protein FHX81_5828 [Saccharothrix saharensis]